jgi:uncharacterized membrane protein
MADPVVPVLQQGQITDEAVEKFRSSVLTSRIWRTTLGKRFLGWFWKSWLGRRLSKRFADAEPPELHGYAYWGPVALAIAVVEILGALSKTFRDTIPWPTISRTVGHIIDVNSIWGIAVVAVIAGTAFAAVSYTAEAHPPGTQRFLGIRYGWPLVYLITLLTALAVRWVISDDKIHLGYAIYGAFAIVGILIPLALVWRKSNRVVFPNVFFTFRKLRERFRWVALTVIALLAVLVLHLALYPWPNLAREPAEYAGLNAFRAREKAEAALRTEATEQNLVYSTQGRGVSEGRNAWFVYFNLVAGPTTTHTGCVVVVTAEAAIPTPECQIASG